LHVGGFGSVNVFAFPLAVILTFTAFAILWLNRHFTL
jgi:hypothetical protein